MQKWASCVCAVLIVNSIFHMLTPNGSLKEPVKFVLNLFLISLIITPIFNNVSSYRINDLIENNFNNNFKINLENKTKNQQKKNLELALNLILKKEGFKNFKIVINKNSNQTSEIIITISKNENVDEIKLKSLIKKETGLEPKLILTKN